MRRASITPDWASAGIPLDAVAPGTMRAAMMAALLASEDMRAHVDSLVPVPLNYHQPPESIAALLLWLTGAENTHTTGQVTFCDGGADATVRGDGVFA